MTRIIRAVSLITIWLLAGGSFAAAEAHLRCVKVSITNPSGQQRKAEDIVINIAQLKAIAPDFYAGSQIVTATDAATIEEDAAVLKASELPSQVDDIDGDFQPDELAFQIDLQPHQTRMVTITWGPPDRIFRLRADYQRRTNAVFTNKIDGMGWESERNAFRLYFDQRNAIDLYGKTRSTLQLDRYATPGYVYHNNSPDGRDVYLVADALGIGAVGAWVDGAAQKVSDVDERSWRIISTGPVRAMVELNYKGWKVNGRRIDLRARITQWAGERGFTQEISSSNAGDLILATGLTKQQNIAAARSTDTTDSRWVAMWGEQVVQSGDQAASPIERGTNLGIAIVSEPRLPAKAAEDKKNFLITFPLHDGKATWYALAAWDQEGTNDPVPVGTAPEPRDYVDKISDEDRITSREQFLKIVHDVSARMEAPAQVRIISSAAMMQSAPPDTLKPSHSKSYKEAIDLLKAEIDRTAKKWEPVISSAAPESVDANTGRGFFTEASNQTGEWNENQRGFFWTGEFWTAQLWTMYRQTRDEKYRRWAELWTSRMLGKESSQNHDAGFIYFYSAAPGFDLTRDPKLRDSAMRGADRLVTLYNPKTHLIPSWEPQGDDTIVDCMMNLQLLWWAAKHSGNPRYRDVGLNHALRTAEWFVRDDGSTIQSVHYNPGDNRQVFDLKGGPASGAFKFPNHSVPGERVFHHTHQGFSWQTTWSRGNAWALDGFAIAYRETKDPRLLKVAEKIAEYIARELPQDGVPWYDFNDEGVIYRNRDSSAAAIIANGLLELSSLERDQQKRDLYRAESGRIVQSLIDHYLTPTYDGDSTPSGILRHGCSTRPADTGLVYGQYYLLEALLRLNGEGEHQ